MLIFVKMQKDVNPTEDECFPIQNTQIDQVHLWRHTQKIKCTFLNTHFIKNIRLPEQADARCVRKGLQRIT